MQEENLIEEQTGKFVSLKYPDFRLLWTTQLLAVMASQMQMTALNWHIYLLTNSAVALGLIGLTRFLPILSFSLLSGAVADSYNRKKIVIVAQAVMASLSLLLVFTTFTHSINPIIIYIVTASSALFFAFDLPARQALIPNMLPKEHVSNAMSMNVIVSQTSMIVGPAVAGLLIGRFGLGVVYIVVALLFASAMTLPFFIKAHGSATKDAAEVSLHAMLEGLHFVRRKTLIWSTMLLDFFSTFFSSANALMPIFARDILKVGPEGLGILYAAPAIGAVLAGFTLAHMGMLRKQGMILLGSVIIYGLATALFGISHFFALSLFFLLVLGAGDSISTVIRNTIRQLETPDHIRGRMTAINMIFFVGGPQLGEFEAGLMAALLGGPLSVVVGGLATVVAVVVMGATIPLLRKYDFHKNDSRQNL